MMKDNVIIPLPAQPMAPARPAEPRAAAGRVEPPPQATGGKELPAREATEPPVQEISKVVESLNDYLQDVRRDLKFSVDEGSGRIVIRVLDNTTQEVIREIPPESAVKLASHLRDEGVLGSVGLIDKA